VSVLEDRYGNRLSTSSGTARDAYVVGFDKLLSAGSGIDQAEVANGGHHAAGYEYSTYFNELSLADVNYVGASFRLTIRRPSLHQFAALIQRIAATIGLLGLVYNDVGESTEAMHNRILNLHAAQFYPAVAVSNPSRVANVRSRSLGYQWTDHADQKIIREGRP
jgi:hypothetical protein